MTGLDYLLAVLGAVVLVNMVALIVAGWTENRRDRAIDARIRRRYTGRVE